MANNKKPRPPVTLGSDYRGLTLRWKNNNWHIQFTDPVTNRVRSRVAGRERDEILAVAKGVLSSIGRGKSLLSPKTPFWEVVDHWFEAELIPHKSWDTTKTYQSICETYLLPVWSERQVGRITPLVIDAYAERLAEDEVSLCRQQKIRTVIKSLFRWAKKAGYTTLNQAADLESINNIPTIKDIGQSVLTMGEMLAVASVAEPHYRVHLKSLAYTAMRIGELASVKRENCCFHNNHGVPPLIVIDDSIGRSRVLKPTKNREERFVYIPQELADEIEAFVAEQDAIGTAHPEGIVFTTPSGTILRDRNFREKVFIPAYKKAVERGLFPEKKVCPTTHVTRHSHATLLREGGLAEHTVTGQLGQKSAQVTRRYTHHTDAAKLEALRTLEKSIKAARTPPVKKGQNKPQ